MCFSIDRCFCSFRRTGIFWKTQVFCRRLSVNVENPKGASTGLGFVSRSLERWRSYMWNAFSMQRQMSFAFTCRLSRTKLFTSSPSSNRLSFPLLFLSLPRLITYNWLEMFFIPRLEMHPTAMRKAWHQLQLDFEKETKRSAQLDYQLQEVLAERDLALGDIEDLRDGMQVTLLCTPWQNRASRFILDRGTGSLYGTFFLSVSFKLPPGQLRRDAKSKKMQSIWTFQNIRISAYFRRIWSPTFLLLSIQTGQMGQHRCITTHSSVFCTVDISVQ